MEVWPGAGEASQAAAETWIRLYESALARANAAELKVAGQAGIKA